MMSVQPTIIFDLDGTLADTIPDLVSAMNRSLAQSNIRPVTPAQVSHLTAKGGLRDMIKYALQAAQVEASAEIEEVLFKSSVADYKDNLVVQSALYPGARAVIERLEGAGWLLGVCTNKPQALAISLLAQLDVEQHFKAIAGVDRFQFRKPDPRHLLETVKLVGGRPERSVMVGDTSVDFLVARNADIPSIAVDFGYSEQPVESYNPDKVISHFDELYDVASKLIH